MSERRQDFLKRFDWIRTALMFEPRGHDMMSGAILYPPTRADCDIGVLFIETSGCLPMCGHGTIGTVTIALEHGLVAPKSGERRLRLDTPAGLVEARYERRRPLRRGGAADATCRSYLAATEREASTCPASASSSSTSPMAATSTPSSSRSRPTPGSTISPGEILRLSPIVRRAVNQAVDDRAPGGLRRSAA